MATREDAHLLVQLLRWGNELGVEEALRTLFSDGFDPDGDTMDEPAVAKALTYGEVVSTLVKHDLLDGDLVRDMIWFEGIWQRVAPHVRAAREHSQEPRLYENFEAFATAGAQAGAA